MQVEELEAQIKQAPLSDRPALERMRLFVTTGAGIRPEFENHLEGAKGYQEFFAAIYADTSLKDTLIWAECAKLSRRNWLSFFSPKIFVQNLRMRTDGLPIQMGSGVVLAPTGSRDNIANLYVFPSKGFNANAAEFVTSIGGQFTVADYDFCGIYGIYKYRGNVILEEWEVEHEAVYNPESARGKARRP